MAEPGSEHPNVVSYKRTMEAFKLVSAQVEYVVPGRSPLAGHTHDISGLLGMLRQSKELSQGTLRLELRSVVADDEHLFVYGRIRAERAGKKLDSDHCVVFRFENGKIVAGRTVPVDLYEFDEFWA